MSFLQKLRKIIKKNNSLLCVGLDTDIKKIPKAFLLKKKDPIFEFNKSIVDATCDLVCAYKPNIAYYAAEGITGFQSLIKTVHYIHTTYPTIPIILDAKRADIGLTSEQYAREVFDVIGVDAVTVNPYLGLDALVPFLKRKDKGIIILCRTSNPGASDFQDLKVEGTPLYVKIAERVVLWNKEYGNCLMVVGATWPKELKKMREIARDMFFLIPGVGTQGGNLQKTLEFGLTKEKSGLIINVSRAIIYASSVRIEAKKFCDIINRYRPT